MFITCRGESMLRTGLILSAADQHRQRNTTILCASVVATASAGCANGNQRGKVAAVDRANRQHHREKIQPRKIAADEDETLEQDGDRPADTGDGCGRK